MQVRRATRNTEGKNNKQNTKSPHKYIHVCVCMHGSAAYCRVSKSEKTHVRKARGTVKYSFFTCMGSFLCRLLHPIHACPLTINIPKTHEVDTRQNLTLRESCNQGKMGSNMPRNTLFAEKSGETERERGDCGDGGEWC